MSLNTKSKTSRKVFLINRSKDDRLIKSLVTAAGTLFIKVVDGRIYLLLISYTDQRYSLLDDLGGRAEVYDKSIYQTIDREVKEESNEIIQIDSENLECTSVYMPECKYLCLITKLNEDAYPDTSIFGTLEHTNQLKRTIEWHEFTDQLKPKLSHRIRQQSIYDELLKLVK